MLELVTATEMKHVEDTPVEELETLEVQVVHFLQSNNITIGAKDMAAYHMLPRKIKDAKPAIILRCCGRKHNGELLRQAKMLNGTGAFFKLTFNQK